MNPTPLFVLLIATLLIIALAGPRLIQVASPVLTRYPRTAVIVLISGIVMWLVTFISIGPLIAWMTTSTANDASAGICRRCLESSNPWAEPLFRLGIPTNIVMAAPALLVFGAVATALVRMGGDRVAARRTAADMRSRGRLTSIRGYRVRVLPDEHPSAFALPRRLGGIVVSTAALRVLSAPELDAVLAHEQAHLNQRHHTIAAISDHIARVFKPVPLIRHSASAVPLYLEIAADNAARRLTGTRPLASAILKLIHGDETAAHAPTHHLALHAVGSHRIRTLLDDNEPQGRAKITLLATSVQNAVLIAFSASVALPWLVAMTSGCS